jgi:hypothetical protein
MNCLDVAIINDRCEVVRVLLMNENWHQLIDNCGDHLITGEKESPQLVRMFSHKMYDEVRLVLDNCRTGRYSFNFTKIDPDFKSLSKHPLMMMAVSGEESLLKHETVEKLLQLKWRFYPRLLFYVNIIVYMVFLFLFSIYASDLADYGRFVDNYINKLKENNSSSSSSSSSNENSSIIISQLLNCYEGSMGCYKPFKTEVFYPLLVVIIVRFLKQIFDLALHDGFGFFTIFQNWCEIITYTTALYAMLSGNFTVKSTYISISILMAYVVFAFIIQKLKVIFFFLLMTIILFIRTLSMFFEVDFVGFLKKKIFLQKVLWWD